MDIYQLILTHNRKWSPLEFLSFCVLFLAVAAVLIILLRKRKIVLSQMISGLLFVIYLGLVLASTVFTRSPDGMYHYELIPFWSWREVLIGNTYMLTEIVLNIILLIPIGILLPVMFRRKIKWWQGLLTGAMISSVIEIAQLVSCRGLFEWDDMIHNGIGCMAGCIIMEVLRKVQNKISRFCGME